MNLSDYRVGSVVVKEQIVCTVYAIDLRYCSLYLSRQLAVCTLPEDLADSLAQHIDTCLDYYN